MGSGLNFVFSIYEVKGESPKEKGMQGQSQRLCVGALVPNAELSGRRRRVRRGQAAEGGETKGG